MTIQEEIEIMIDRNNKLYEIWKFQEDLPAKRVELSKRKDEENQSYITNYTNECSKKIGLADAACIKMEFDEKSKHIYFVMIVGLKNSAYREHQIILENHLRFDHFKP